MPLTTSDLIFPEQANNEFGRILTELKRSTLSIRNRLESICQDSEFALKISALYKKPLVANERCGSWYIHPDRKVASAYFKSTDGHTGVWKFSSRRLNFHLLEIIGANDGCVIIDSTRRGKSMPDALSKTIPIWCAVLNRYFFPEKIKLHALYTPPQLVSLSEHAQISARIPDFVAALQTLKIPASDLRNCLHKPLRPIWVTPDSVAQDEHCTFLDFHPIICCTVSRRVTGDEISAFGYIQGAGDDTENWAHGLNPNLFWANKEAILSSPDPDLPAYIEKIVREYRTNMSLANELHCIKPTSSLFVTSLDVADTLSDDKYSCIFLLQPDLREVATIKNKMSLGIGKDKLASRNLRKRLPLIMEFLKTAVLQKDEPEEREPKQVQIVVACQTGSEIAIAVALAILCLVFDEKGNLMERPRDQWAIDKVLIRSMLSWISISIPEANPSRATLQSVNSYLMSRPEY